MTSRNQFVDPETSIDADMLNDRYSEPSRKGETSSIFYKNQKEILDIKKHRREKDDYEEL